MKTSAPAYSFAIKNNNKHGSAAPAPNYYSPNFNPPRYQAPSHTFGWKLDPKYSGHDVPGVGIYNIQTTLMNRQKTASFGKIRNSPIFKAQQPGPSDYSPQPSKVKRASPVYSLKGKNRYQPDNHIPGPGSYTPNKLKSNKSIRINPSPSKGNINPQRNSPGPGSYLNPSSPLRNKGWTMGIHLNNDKLNVRQNSPGPGQYQISKNLQNSKKKIPIGIRLKNQIDRSIPGPGQYNLDSYKKSGKSFKFGLSRERNNKSCYEPGPGSYLKDQSWEKPTYVMSRASRQKFIDETKITPGPGHYNNMPQKRGLTATLKSRSKQKLDTSVPGPGAYSPQIEAESKFSKTLAAYNYKSKRFSDKFIQEPGPGYYNINLNKKNGIIFGKQKRSPNLKGDSPGPGFYQIPSTISNLPQYARRHTKI